MSSSFSLSSITSYARQNPITTGLVAVGVVGLGLLGYKLYSSRSQQLQVPHWDTSVTGEKFYAAITAAKTHSIAQEKMQGVYKTGQSKQHGAFVHAYSAEDYSKMQLFLLNDGSEKGVAGVAVKDGEIVSMFGGDIVSVFKHPACKVSRVVDKYLMPQALAHGGDHLDCFDGVLPKLYARNGFVPVAKTPFNEEFAPEDWNYERDGKPDIIFMKYTGEKLKDVQAAIDMLEPSASYEEAQKIQLESLS